ncbi:hypothetical protein STEG23_027802 [Scotinomys teguina]
MKDAIMLTGYYFRFLLTPISKSASPMHFTSIPGTPAAQGEQPGICMECVHGQRAKLPSLLDFCVLLLNPLWDLDIVPTKSDDIALSCLPGKLKKKEKKQASNKTLKLACQSQVCPQDTKGKKSYNCIRANKCDHVPVRLDLQIGHGVDLVCGLWLADPWSSIKQMRFVLTREVTNQPEVPLSSLPLPLQAPPNLPPIPSSNKVIKTGLWEECGNIWTCGLEKPHSDSPTAQIIEMTKIDFQLVWIKKQLELLGTFSTGPIGKLL